MINIFFSIIWILVLILFPFLYIKMTPPMAKWLAAPVKAVKAIINTLVPTLHMASVYALLCYLSLQ